MGISPVDPLSLLARHRRRWLSVLTPAVGAHGVGRGGDTTGRLKLPVPSRPGPCSRATVPLVQVERGVPLATCSECGLFQSQAARTEPLVKPRLHQTLSAPSRDPPPQGGSRCRETLLSLRHRKQTRGSYAAFLLRGPALTTCPDTVSTPCDPAKTRRGDGLLAARSPPTAH